MKTILTLLLIFLLAIAGIKAVSDMGRTSIATEVFILKDVTEDLISQPEENKILGLYNMADSAKWNGESFHFSNITEVSYNKVLEVIISPANQWLSNEPERDNEIKNFKNSVAEIISDTSGGKKERKNSSVYLPIARSLQSLSESKAKQKILIVYSDLMENSPATSFYDAEEFSLLEKHSEDVREKLNSLQALPSLNGIEVYLLNEPGSITGDTKYKVVSDFYREWLEGKGAKVYISANLNQHMK